VVEVLTVGFVVKNMMGEHHRSDVMAVANCSLDAALIAILFSVTTTSSSIHSCALCSMPVGSDV